MPKREPQEEAVGLLSSGDFLHEKERYDGFRHQQHSEIFALILSCVAKSMDFARRGLLFLLPSFISTAITQPRRPQESAPLRPTAYLDGLRGLAAWSVFNAHLSALLLKSTGGGWGHPGGHTEFYKLPIVRLMYKGDFAVGLFFVISGFALSIGPVAAMKKFPRDPGTAMEKLAGTVLRRPIRLYFPAFASTMIVFFLLRADFFGFLSARQSEFETYIWGWPVMDEWPPRNSSFFAQLLDMLKGNADMLSIFKQAYDSDFGVNYNGVLWTVKLEFRSSLVLYLTHTALFYMRKPVRIAITIGLIISGLSIWAFDFPLFWTGYLIAEYFEPPTAEAKERGHIFKSAAYWLLIILGGAIGSFPAWDAINTPNYAWLIPYTPFHFLPTERFWTGLGAALVVLSIPKLPLMLKIYNSAPVQYMGKISFGFYLVHFWVVHCLGTLIFYRVWQITGKDGPISAFIGFMIAYAMLIACTIWVADVFWRCIDKPSVSFATIVQKWLFQER